MRSHFPGWDCHGQRIQKYFPTLAYFPTLGSGVRAAAAVAGQDGLPATSAKHKSWRAMYSGPGEPSGATWRPRWRPLGLTDGPDAHSARNPVSGGREGVKAVSLLLRAALARSTVRPSIQ